MPDAEVSKYLVAYGDTSWGAVEFKSQDFMIDRHGNNIEIFF